MEKENRDTKVENRHVMRYLQVTCERILVLSMLFGICKNNLCSVRRVFSNCTDRSM